MIHSTVHQLMTVSLNKTFPPHHHPPNVKQSNRYGPEKGLSVPLPFPNRSSTNYPSLTPPSKKVHNETKREKKKRGLDQKERKKKRRKGENRIKGEKRSTEKDKALTAYSRSTRESSDSSTVLKEESRSNPETDKTTHIVPQSRTLVKPYTLH